MAGETEWETGNPTRPYTSVAVVTDLNRYSSSSSAGVVCPTCRSSPAYVQRDPNFARKHTRGEAAFTHPDEHQIPLPALPALRDSPEVKERQAVAKARRLDGQLDDFRAGRAHGRGTRGQIGRHAVEVVIRKDDATAGRGRDEIVEVRAPLDVHVLGAKCKRLAQDRAPVLFGAAKVSTLPLRPAGDDRRQSPALECAGDVRVADRVDAQFDHVGADNLVASAAKFGGGRRGHGDAKHCMGQKQKSPFNRQAEEAQVSIRRAVAGQAKANAPSEALQYRHPYTDTAATPFAGLNGNARRLRGTRLMNRRA